jgi:hypothetical protein
VLGIAFDSAQDNNTFLLSPFRLEGDGHEAREHESGGRSQFGSSSLSFGVTIMIGSVSAASHAS